MIYVQRVLILPGLASINMKTKLFLLILFIFTVHTAGAQNWSWIKRGPGTNVARIKGNAITLDRFLNHIIITGIGSSNYGAGERRFLFTLIDFQDYHI